MKRDLYAEVSTRIVALLEAGAAPWVKPWSATAGMNTPCNAVTNRPYSGCNVLLLWMAQTAGYRTPRFLTFKQALELGGNVRKGEHGTKVYFVKQHQVHDKGSDDNSATRLVPLMREYTVFNVDQCETYPIAFLRGSQCAFVIPTRATSLPTLSCAPPELIFAKARVKRFMCRAAILFRCRRSMRSRARIISTTWPSMNSRIRRDTSRALIEI